MLAPSQPLDALVNTAALRPTLAESMQALMYRAAEFASPLQARLTGLMINAGGRELTNQFLDDWWSQPQRQQELLQAGTSEREIIIGGGFHAAVYAAGRVLRGLPKPLVLERDDRVGGTFAMTERPTFYLNSRNRGGNPGPAGDYGASPNHLPGAPVQAANLSMAEYQSNADLALVVRLTLAQYADVVPAAAVTAVTDHDGALTLALAGRDPVSAARVIDARGLGDPRSQSTANGATLLSFAQLMRRMAGSWPLRGVRRVAVIGDGDSATCAVEALLGIAPPPPMAAVALDTLERIDWYAPQLPATCRRWRKTVRGRYQAIGRHLRPDRFGVRRLRLLNRRATPVALADAALIDSQTYDLAILCTGNQETRIDGLQPEDFTPFSLPTGLPVARVHYDLPVFRVGPHARIPFTFQERDDGIADFTGNAVSMFRTAAKTAALAATLPPVSPT